MSYYGTFSSTIGAYLFGPLSVFLWMTTTYPVEGASPYVAGPAGPYEWFYLSETPDLNNIFAYATLLGFKGTPLLESYVGSKMTVVFNVTRDVFVSGPYMVVYTPYSPYLATLQLPIALIAFQDTTLYILFYFENIPLN